MVWTHRMAGLEMMRRTLCFISTGAMPAAWRSPIGSSGRSRSGPGHDFLSRASA